MIETKIKKNKEEAKTVKKIKNDENKKELRPQDIYSDIGVDRTFDRHFHQNFL